MGRCLRYRERFLRRQEVKRLTRYPDDLVKRAVRYSSKLADALELRRNTEQPLGRASSRTAPDSTCLLQSSTIGIETIARCIRRSARSRTMKTTSNGARTARQDSVHPFSEHVH